MTRICLHGPESTGKSELAAALAAHFGCEAVPEYGRSYCEVHGTDIDMAALVHIGQVQDALNWEASARAGQGHVIFDTDSQLSSVWADIMFGVRDPWFDSAEPSGELYLLMDIDLPFVDDGLRVYSQPSDRACFFELCKQVLDRKKVRFELISGTGEARFQAALNAIEAHT
jgi:nicotinamide riboside kinase